MTSRRWISDAAIENNSGPGAILQYVKKIAGMLLLVSTTKGRKVIKSHAK